MAEGSSVPYCKGSGCSEIITYDQSRSDTTAAPLGCVALLAIVCSVVPDLVGEVAAEKASYLVDPRRLKPQGDLLRNFGADMLPPVPMLGNSRSSSVLLGGL